MKEVVSRKENTSRRAESNTESVSPSQLKAAPPFQLFAGSEKPAQLNNGLEEAEATKESKKEDKEKDKAEQIEVSTLDRKQKENQN
jgi:hypothetical protein